jgi:hypothetical protein
MGPRAGRNQQPRTQRHADALRDLVSSGPRRPMYIVRRDPPWCPVTGKLRFGTRVEAIMTLRETQAKKRHGQTNREEQRVYDCEFCKIDGKNGWHMTSQPYDETRRNGQENGNGRKPSANS